MTGISGNSSPFLEENITIPEEEDRLKIFLYDTFTSNIISLNAKTVGTYAEKFEVFNGESWSYVGNTPTNGNFAKTVRNGFRIFVYIPSYPNAGPLAIANPIQGIDTNFNITNSWGTANKPVTTPGTGDYFSFVCQGDTRVTYAISDTTITITTTTNLSAYRGYIVIEYLRIS